MIASGNESTPRVKVIRGDPATQPSETARRRGPVQPVGPLLRSLLAWDLVERVATGVWQLVPAAQKQLEEAFTSQQPEEGVIPVVGLYCEACGAGGLTWQTNGLRLCQGCLDDSKQEPPPLDQVKPGEMALRATAVLPFTG